MTLFLKDPGASLVHSVNWDAGYLAGRRIVTSTWSVMPAAGNTPLAIDQAEVAGGQTRAKLTGGQAGKLYRVTNRIMLSDGGTDERTLLVRVEDR